MGLNTSETITVNSILDRLKNQYILQEIELNKSDDQLIAIIQDYLKKDTRKQDEFLAVLDIFQSIEFNKRTENSNNSTENNEGEDLLLHFSSNSANGRKRLPETATHSPTFQAKRTKASDISPRNVASPSSMLPSKDENKSLVSAAKAEVVEELKKRCELSSSSHHHHHLSNRTGGQWALRACATLHVKVNESIKQLMNDVMSCLVLMKKRENESPGSHRVNDMISAFLEVLSKCPNRIIGDSLKKSPSEKSVSELDEAALQSIQAVHQLEAAKATSNTLLPAVKDSIGKLTEACAAHVARFPLYNDSEAILTRMHNKTLNHLSSILKDIEKDEKKIMNDLVVAKTELAERHRAQNHELRVIDQKLATFREEIRAEDSSKTESEVANLANYRFYQQSSSSERGSSSTLASLESNIKNQKVNISILTERLGWIQHLGKLCALVLVLREDSIKRASASFAMEKATVEEVATKAIRKYVGSLCQFLKTYDAQHAFKRKKATEKCEKLRNEIEEHKETFGDQAPLDLQLMEKSLKQYLEFNLQSKHDLHKLGDAQVEHWKASLPLLPESLRADVREDLKALYSGVDTTLRMVFERLFNAYTSTSRNNSSSLPSSSTSASSTASPLLKNRKSTIGSASGKASKPASAASTSRNSAASQGGKWQNPNASFKIGDKVTTKFLIGGKVNKLIAGKVQEMHPDGSYRVRYEDGEVHSFVDRQYLLTDQEIEALKATEQDEETDENDEQGGGNCVIM